MISLCPKTNLSTLAFIFYAFVWAPLIHLTRISLRFATFLLDPHFQPQTEANPDSWELDLPVSWFQGAGEEEEACSICLMEFMRGDDVNKLPNCGHMFHVGCLDEWLDRCRFTCPLCRSFVLRSVRSSPCKMWPSSLVDS